MAPDEPIDDDMTPGVQNEPSVSPSPRRMTQPSRRDARPPAQRDVKPRWHKDRFKQTALPPRMPDVPAPRDLSSMPPQPMPIPPADLSETATRPLISYRGEIC